MPATSQKQFRFMEAIAHGGIKKPGLSAEKAKEYVSENTGEQSYKKLPEEHHEAKKRALNKFRGK
jgi:hypothetical protein